jgi:beta-fructofuranosidase
MKNYKRYTKFLKMVSKRYFLAGGIMITLLICSCKKDTISSNAAEPYVEAKFNIFPKPANNPATGSTRGWVGDVMPYFVNGQFEIFYLHDAPDAVKQTTTGQHAIHKFTSKDLLNFSDDGEMIGYGNVNTQDQLIGTGSMIKTGDTYYYYYTGFNSNANWLTNNNPGWTGANTREAIMYATSKDLKTWTKKSDYILKAAEGYSGTDFRDPYVFYNDEFSEYWMLVSTQKSGKAVVLVYTTANPSTNNWAIKGPLNVEGDYLMFECSDIVKMGGKYYMFFAEDWSNTPGTHYRVASSTAGPWLKPADGQDMFDGHQFYAGRGVTDGTKYYTLGWAHRRNPETDNGTRTWGGNLISHEFFKLGNDKIGVKSPASVSAYFNKDTDVTIKGQAGTVSNTSADYTLNGNAGGALYKFAAIDGTLKVKGSFSLGNLTGSSSMAFNTQADNSSSYSIKFEPAARRIAAYNNGTEVTRVPFTFEKDKSYTFSVVIDGSVAVLYVNDEVALTNRIYSMQDHSWSLSADGLQLNVQGLKISKH